MLAGAGDAPAARTELEATVCWLGEHAARAGARYRLQHTTRTVRALVDEVVDRLDIDTLERDPRADALQANDVGHLRLRLASPIHADPYERNRAMGSAILVDETSNATVGAVLIDRAILPGDGGRQRPVAA